MLKLRKTRETQMQSCPECDTYMQLHAFNGKHYYTCTKCGKEVIVTEGQSREKMEKNINEEKNDAEMNDDTNEEEMKEYTNEEERITEDKYDSHITEAYHKKEKIRNILTPDVIACQKCIDEYKEDISCSKCDIVMLKPDYNGKIYECPICGKLYCDTCWDKTE